MYVHVYITILTWISINYAHSLFTYTRTQMNEKKIQIVQNINVQRANCQLQWWKIESFVSINHDSQQFSIKSFLFRINFSFLNLNVIWAHRPSHNSFVSFFHSSFPLVICKKRSHVNSKTLDPVFFYSIVVAKWHQ